MIPVVNPAKVPLAPFQGYGVDNINAAKNCSIKVVMVFYTTLSANIFSNQAQNSSSLSLIVLISAGFDIIFDNMPIIRNQ